MAGEEWARRIVQKELKQAVHLHDDGSMSGMYDLRIGPANAPEVAIECVGAVDSKFAETWNVGPGRGPFTFSVKGDWFITISSGARVNVIKRNIEHLLQELETRGVSDIRVNFQLEWQDKALFDSLTTLGITDASCYNAQGEGKVHFSMPGIGGVVDEHGNAIPEWVGSFLRAPAQQDVLSKLQRSGAPERQVFVLLTFGGVPWPVASYFGGLLDLVPSQTPDLPSPVTGVWIGGGPGQKGLRWDGTAWQLFETRDEGNDT